MQQEPSKEMLRRLALPEIIQLSMLCVLALAVRTIYLQFDWSPDELGQLFITKSSWSVIYSGANWEPHPFLSFALRHLMLLVSDNIDYLKLFSVVPSVLL